MQFEQYAEGAAPALLRLARVLTGERALAEDLLQDVLVKLVRAWPRLNHIADMDAYARRMIVNEYTSHGRRRVRASALHRHFDPDLPVDVADRVTDQLTVRAEVAKLPPRQKAVVVLRYYLGLGDEEIAADLGCSPATVRSHASRAMATLRIELAANTKEAHP